MKAGEWTLRSRRVVTPSGTRPADVLIHRESIVGLLEHEGPEAEGIILDVGDLAVLPGLVALHRVAPESLEGSGFATITREASAGGLTTLISLPSNRDPGSVTQANSLKRLIAAEGTIQVDCGMVVRLGQGRADQIESWIEAGVIGVEAVLNGLEPDRISREADLRLAMPLLAELGRPLIVQSGKLDSASTGEGSSALRLLIRLCRETRCRVHLLDHSSSEDFAAISEARAEGLPLTLEASASQLARSPRLWDRLKQGQIDSIAPDQLRADPFPILDGQGVAPDRGWLRLTLADVWVDARPQGFTLDQLAHWMAGKPAEVVGLSTRKGSIAPGLDADFVVFDPDDPKPSNQVLATILRGTLIYQSGRFFDHPKGAIVLRLEETQPLPGIKA